MTTTTSWVAVRHDEPRCSAPTDERSARELVASGGPYVYALPLEAGGIRCVFGRDGYEYRIPSD